MTLFTRLEEQKAAIVRSIEQWPHDRLSFRPAPDEWSALDVLDHLVRVEAGILAATRRGVRNPHRRSLRDRLGFLFIERVFRSRRRVKVPPSAAAVLPSPDVTLEGILQRWTATRRDLAQLLDEVSNAQLRGGVFRHPVSGWMDLTQVLRFLSVHLHHHTYQLTRIEAAFSAALPQTRFT